MQSQNTLALTRTHTAQEAPLGSEVTEYDETSTSTSNRGIRKWIYVQMTGSAAAAGTLCMRAGTNPTYVVSASSAAALPPLQIVGVAQHAIAQNSFGWIGRQGDFTVRMEAGAGVTAPDLLVASGATAGSMAAGVQTALTSGIGIAHTDIAAGATGRARIYCIG